MSEETDVRAKLWDSKLDVIRTEVRQGFDSTCERLEAVEVKVGKLDNVLRGDESRPGITIRLDRIEQTEGRRTWRDRLIAGAAVSSIVGLLIKILWDALGK